MRMVIIVGTSNPLGNTIYCTNLLAKALGATVIDLNHYQISMYDYQHKNQHDDFLKIVKEVSKYDLIIFASPVYWYAMSTPMKLFFDRLSDLLTVSKPLGRSLKGKHTALISTGAQSNAPSCFVEPFTLTAAYFDMRFIDNYYLQLPDHDIGNNREAIQSYIDNVKHRLSLCQSAVIPASG